MANMSYCRWQNTLTDLMDCAAHVDDNPDELGDDERRARTIILEVCEEMLDADHARLIRKQVRDAATR